MIWQGRQGTIVARATPAGTGAVAVIRLSGDRVRSILQRILQNGKGRGPLDRPRRMCNSRIVDSEERCLDESLVVFFPGPASYTGEDLAEIHCHGGEAVVEALLARLTEVGARPAQRGEFTRRAFENGKMDLSRAEAVLRVIEAGTREQLLAAQRLLEGEFGRSLARIQQDLSGLLAHAEASVDFPDEPEAIAATLSGLTPLVERVERLLAMAKRRVDPGCEVVIAGRPNVGKSSLVNAVTGRKISIVADQPGTTRDAVSTGILLGGMNVILVDTAGTGSDRPEGTVELEAARVAKEHIQRAGMLVWVTDRPEEEPEPVPREAGPRLWVLNKSDLIPSDERSRVESRVRERGGVLVSALTGEGIEGFLERTGRELSAAYGPSDGVPVTIRQQSALNRLKTSLERADRALSEGQVELAAADVREALESVGELNGENLEVDVLDLIFGEFCIGK